MSDKKHAAIVGSPVAFIDENGGHRDALVTYVHGDEPVNATINLVYVTGDENSTDQYGRQIVRKTSVSHVSRTTARGYYWTIDQ